MRALVVEDVGKELIGLIQQGHMHDGCIDEVQRAGAGGVAGVIANDTAIGERHLGILQLRAELAHPRREGLEMQGLQGNITVEFFAVVAGGESKLAVQQLTLQIMEVPGAVIVGDLALEMSDDQRMLTHGYHEGGGAADLHGAERPLRRMRPGMEDEALRDDVWKGGDLHILRQSGREHGDVLRELQQIGGSAEVGDGQRVGLAHALAFEGVLAPGGVDERAGEQ